MNTRQIIRRQTTHEPFFYLVALTVGAVFGMLLSFILDTATSIPGSVWVTIWIAMAIIPPIAPPIARAFSPFRGLNSDQESLVSRYFDLPKELRKDRLPRDFIDTVKMMNDKECRTVGYELSTLDRQYAKLLQNNPQRTRRYSELIEAIQTETEICAEITRELREHDVYSA